MITTNIIIILDFIPNLSFDEKQSHCKCKYIYIYTLYYKFYKTVELKLIYQ